MSRRWGGLLVLLFSPLSLGSPPPDPLGPPPPPPGPFVDRGPISITSDSDWDLAHGVVSGTGTPADPFVISGWRIVAPAGTFAIRIQNTTKAFRLENLLLDARASGASGILLYSHKGPAHIREIYVVSRNVGIQVGLSDPFVEQSTIVGASTPPTGVGVVLSSSNANLTRNLLFGWDVGLQSTLGHPTLWENGFHSNGRGVSFVLTDRARMWGDRIVDTRKEAVLLDRGSQTLLAGVTLEGAGTGVDVKGGSVGLTGCSLRSVQIALRSQSAVVVLEGNTFAGGSAGWDIQGGSIVARSNSLATFETTAIRIGQGTVGVLESNFIARSGGGIELLGGPFVAVRNSTLLDNAWGFSIPYESRLSLPLLLGNFVNGFNIDGTVFPPQRVYYFRTSSVLISNQIRDAGASLGRYGALSKEGSLVFYEVQGALVFRTTISNELVGVRSVNSFNVSIVESFLVNDRIGIWAESRPSPSVVPLSTLGVKNTTLTLIVDPFLTTGVRVGPGVFATVRNSSVSRFETGIHFEPGARGDVQRTKAFLNVVGIRMEGSPSTPDWDLKIESSTVDGNVDGILLRNFRGTVRSTEIRENLRTGVRLVTSFPQIGDSQILRNGWGVRDELPCALLTPACSGGTFERTQFVSNRAGGLLLNGSSTITDSLILSNGGWGAILGSSRLERNVVENNSLGGLLLTGEFITRENLVRSNRGDGVLVRGTLRSLRDAFLLNDRSGIHFQGILLEVLEGNSSYNFDGVLVEPLPVVLPTLPSLPQIPPPSQEPQENRDPVRIHFSDLVGNTRNAVRSPLLSDVNATRNFWGSPRGPGVNLLDLVGGSGNTVTPTVRFVPWFRDPSHTTTGPVGGL